MSTVENNNYFFKKNEGSLVAKQESFIGRTVKWLRGTEQDSRILSIFKKAVTYLLSMFLVCSVFGLPLFIAGKTEWKRQKSSDVVKLVNGTQGVSYGKTQKDRVAEIFSQLEKDQPMGIKFNKNAIKGDVRGGNCTAMSLDFASEYLKMKKKSEISEATPLKVLIERIKMFASQYNLGRTEINMEFRNRQKAFNCIEVDRQQQGGDFSLAKVQSLANFHFLKITDVSEEFTYLDWDHKKTKDKLIQVVNKLQNGIHFLRDLFPSENKKLEEHGHSMVLIKEEQGAFFYDPNTGVELINRNVAGRIFDILRINFLYFKVLQSRFYKLEAIY